MKAVKRRMADRVAEFDWKTTPLGATENWSPSLRTAVDICLASPVASFVWWGPRLINIYNDAYAPLMGAKDATGLGRPASEVWSDIWDTVAGDVERVLHKGASIVHERKRFVAKRDGYPDVMYFTYTFSPIPDGHGGVGGIFQIALDETPRVLAEREAQRARARVDRNLKTTKAENEQRLARWQAIIANTGDGVVLVDTHGHLCDWNAKAIEMFGWSGVADTRKHFNEVAADVDVYDINGTALPIAQRPISRLLRGEPIHNVTIRMRHRDHDRDVVAVCNGALIHGDDDKARMALLTLHESADEIPSPLKPQPLSSAPKPSSRPGLFQNAADRAIQAAAESARAAESLLANMHLTPGDQAFCTSLGQDLVESAIDAYLDANAETRHWLNGSCVAASLAVALIIVQDV